MTPSCTPCPFEEVSTLLLRAVSLVERLAVRSSWLLPVRRLLLCGAAVVKQGLLQIGEATGLVESSGLTSVLPILGDCGGVSEG